MVDEMIKERWDGKDDKIWNFDHLTINQPNQSIDGISHLTSHSIIHLDLKPENILLEKKGDEVLMKILNNEMVDYEKWERREIMRWMKVDDG